MPQRAMRLLLIGLKRINIEKHKAGNMARYRTLRFVVLHTGKRVDAFCFFVSVSSGQHAAVVSGIKSGRETRHLRALYRTAPIHASRVGSLGLDLYPEIRSAGEAV